jgi:hypothetical protein
LCKIFCCWPGNLSRYSGSLLARWSGDRIPVVARFSAPVQTCPGAHPASYTMGTVSFAGVKRPGCSVDYPLSTIAKVKERVELYIYSLPGPSWPVIGWTLHLKYVVTFDVITVTGHEKYCLLGRRDSVWSDKSVHLHSGISSGRDKRFLLFLQSPGQLWDSRSLPLIAECFVYFVYSVSYVFLLFYWHECSVLYILCQLAISGYPDWSFSVPFPQL